ncbi:MAG: hypothetical protein V7632_2952 [Bradyrhizobium sp.]|jgi:hypothetical protein
MLDDEFNKRQSRLIRELADKADPFIKRRLLDLAARYDAPRKTKPLPIPSIIGPQDIDRDNDSGETS